MSIFLSSNYTDALRGMNRLTHCTTLPLSRRIELLKRLQKYVQWDIDDLTAKMEKEQPCTT